MTDGPGIIERFYREVMEGGDLGLISELAGESYTGHEEPLPGQPPGLDGLKFFITTFRKAFPDIRVKTVGPVMADEGMEAARFVLTGTHRGEFLGVAPTGNTVELSGVDMIRIQDGKAVEHWGSSDMLELMQQIGAVRL